MKHCILIKFKDEVNGERRKQALSEIGELFANACSVEGVAEVRLRPNIVANPNRFDLMIEMDMTPEVLTRFDSSVWHRQWKEQFGPMLAQKAVIDLE